MKITSMIQYDIPTMSPPAILHSVPISVTPPLVPLRTRLQVVISLGVPPITEPTSDAHVSPQQHASDDRQAKANSVGVCGSQCL